MLSGTQRIALIGACIVLATPASAYKLATKASAEERQLAGITNSYWTSALSFIAARGMPLLTEPVHEEITNRIYGCNGDVCSGSEATQASAAVLAGVRWNDDPPFRMTPKQARGTNCKTGSTIRFETQPDCWVDLFRAAEKGAAAGATYGPGDAMLYRTHFGDLQFLHAMATRDGERASQTKARMMDWFEFAWRAASGEYPLDTRLREIEGNRTITEAFGKSDWRLMDLYTQGASGGLRGKVNDVAFGSLLHALEDSYAAGHVDREESSGSATCSAGSFSVDAPGAVREFHAYNHQDHGAHGAADSKAAFMVAFQQPGNVVDVGRTLVRARQAGMTWSEVKPLFDCVMSLSNPDAPAGPGEDF
jgi:hypothetical protein